MRFSQSYIPTLKEAPADADAVSHQLLLRAGMLRPVARGIYDVLPLGLRVQRKIERIVREEIERAARTKLLPVVHRRSSGKALAAGPPIPARVCWRRCAIAPIVSSASVPRPRR